MSDTSSIIVWWLAIFLIGSIFLPVTFLLFHKFIDKGYAFSKILGIVLTSYLVWLFGSLHILPFTKISIMLILLGATIVNLWFIRNLKRNNNFSISIWLVALEEVLFLLGLIAWSYVRTAEPSLRGLEKFMDFGFVNSILRSEYFPPLDMWLTKSPDYSGGYFINYYYFGHYIAAFLTKLTGIDSAVTYNLMLATIFAFSFTLPFSLGTNLFHFLTLSDQERKNKVATTGVSIKCILVGLLAGFLLSLGGNLHTLYVFTEGYPNESPKPPWQLSLGYHPERYWYPNATRFIPFTIHEFPIYSFVVADLHGHFSDIPLVLLNLGLLLALMVKPKDESCDQNSRSFGFLQEFENNTGIPFFLLMLLGLLLGIMYMTNAWDGLIYMIATILVFIYRNIVLKSGNPQTSLFYCFYKIAFASLLLIFFFFIPILPFWLNFKPFVSGVGVLCAPKFLINLKNLGPLMFEADHCQRSPIYQLAILWGFFFFHVFGFLTLILVPKLKLLMREKIKIKVQNYSAMEKIFTGLHPSDVFVFLLIVISTLLLIFPELFYMKDIYPAHYRANTMFKLGYQAFMMLSICSSYIYFRIKHAPWPLRRNFFRIFYIALSFPLFTLVAIYPYFAVNSYYGSLKNYYGLYGLNWMATQYPDDYQVVSWMRKNITGQPVIVEANGDSYTDYDRVSANTGLPTIVGWPVHEWLWRGSYDEAGKRIPEVAKVYEGKTIEEVKEVLSKYNAQYIFVGTLEREKYKNLNEENIKKLGKVVFESGNTRLYKLNTDFVNSPGLPSTNPSPSPTSNYGAIIK